jgi:hypothetical protein
MTRSEMLKKMGLKDEELKDLMQKFRNFKDTLNAHQLRVVTRSLPTVTAAAKTFGDDVTAEDLQQLFGTDATSGSFGAHGLNNGPNQ